MVTGVGASWDLSDPFAGHPSAGDHDLRIRWRQAGDLHGLAGLADLAYCR